MVNNKSKMDYMFIFILNNSETGMAFCSSKNLSIKQAKKIVFEKVQEKKQQEIRKLNFLGTLDYSYMEQEVTDLLFIFEKCEPVWIWDCNWAL